MLIATPLYHYAIHCDFYGCKKGECSRQLKKLDMCLFCPKHMLWVLVRKKTHNLYFEQDLEKNV